MLQASLFSSSSNAARRSPFTPPAALAVLPSSCQRAPNRSRQHSVVRASTVNLSAASTDPRQALRVAIADQLKGPHFNTWLYSKRFDPDRLVIQARRLWYYATLLQPGALGTEGNFDRTQLDQLRTAADNAFQDIQKFRLDNGGWRFSFELDQQPQVHMYTVSFTLYALSTYYAATGSGLALEQANTTFDGISARLAADGGVYPESYQLDYATPWTPDASHPTNALGHYQGRRTVNTHIHLVEALTAFHGLVPKEAKGGDRHQRSVEALEAATDLVRDMKHGPRMIELRDAGDARKPAKNLRPWVPNNQTGDKGEQLMFLPGHNVEATFLVHDAYDVLGKSGPDPSFTNEMLDQAHSRLQDGPAGEKWLPHIMVNDSREDQNGLPHDNSEAAWTIGTQSWEGEINWWAQMELLNALVHADQRLGGPHGAGDVYIQRALKVWDLISTRFVSPTTGALYETLDNNTASPTYFTGVGHPDNGSILAGYGPWKASYHSTRAMVRSLQALCAGFKGSEVSDPVP